MNDCIGPCLSHCCYKLYIFSFFLTVIVFILLIVILKEKRIKLNNKKLKII